jgi:hypothetical protein
MALFYRAGGDFCTCVTYAANFGRDADTIGTMIGALCGAYQGAGAIPAPWMAQLEEGYGKRISVSKEYALKSVELADQRELAGALIRVIEKRAQDREAVRSALLSMGVAAAGAQ